MLISAVYGDLYLHMPRGSNNRLNEESKGRKNGNRLFDSQNNNNGGYNVADKWNNPANNENQQHKEMYFASGKKGKSYLTIEWFNQHGCGAADKDDTNEIDCHLVLQYKCENVEGISNSEKMKNGFDYNNMKFTAKFDRKETYEEEQARKKADTDNSSDMGRHESWENYEVCKKRWRNEGLFIADRDVGDRSCNTRQNNGCGRRGYECPEERDYFPYWHPTEWTDIAILTNNVENCDYYRSESSNSAPKGECVEYYESLEDNPNRNRRKPASMENNQNDCLEHGGEWLEFYDYLHILEG